MSVVIPGGATGVPHGIPVAWSVHPTHTHCVGSSVDLRQGAMGWIGVGLKADTGYLKGSLNWAYPPYTL